MSKHLLFYDTYERHKKVGSFVADGETVLDVGGAKDHLAQFCKPKKIVTVNLAGSENADIIIKKGKLPFAASSFDVVCSIDVLEHLPRKDRADFIADLVRIARKRVVLSFPIATPAHVMYEKKIQKWLESQGKDVTYLKEHIKFGLPEKEEISKITKVQKTAIIYSGNININDFLFRLFMFDPNIKLFRKIIYFLKLMFNIATNPIFYFILSNRKFIDSVNRAYLIIEKQ